MMKFLCLVCFLAAAALAATPPRPNPSEVFFSNINAHLTNPQTHANGKGIFAGNQPQGMSTLQANCHGPAQSAWDVFQLNRYDMGHSYDFNYQGAPTNCFQQNVTGTMPPTWGWLKEAKFEGESFGVATWQYSSGSLTLTMTVNVTVDNNVPLTFTIATPQQTTDLGIKDWTTTVPSGIFSVPE